MSYVTFPELADRIGALELSQVAGSEYLLVVDPALMDATLRALDRSAWPAEQLEAADAAAARIADAVAEAGAIIDGFLVQRGYALPLVLTPTSTGKSVLSAWARAITRYLLQKNRQGDPKLDPVVRDYQDAMKMLQLLADGKYSLGAGDPTQPSVTGATDVRFEGDAAVFSRAELRAFR
ncbi:phage protein Gp36 family protein [Variovorax sp.]|uniref:phage protein Gp36 family protein n=1 Tax=Variovorax sp. TaxID=1871043 RepID=UPI003BAB64D7